VQHLNGLLVLLYLTFLLYLAEMEMGLYDVLPFSTETVGIPGARGLRRAQFFTAYHTPHACTPSYLSANIHSQLPTPATIKPPPPSPPTTQHQQHTLYSLLLQHRGGGRCNAMQRTALQSTMPRVRNVVF
jgi:hypothetical protein